MRLTWKDAAATVLVAAIVVPYVVYLDRGEVLFVDSARWMAATALVLGFGACAAGATIAAEADLMGRTARVLGYLALGLGVATLVFGSEWLLAGFVGVIVLLWALTTVRHAVRQPAAATTRPKAGAPR